MHFSQNKKMFIFLSIFYVFSLISTKIYSENIYFFTRTTFANSQFWERNQNDADKDLSRKIFANYFSGSIGAGMEMVIWDYGIKRGSRLFWKTGIDLVFSGISYAGAYNDISPGGSRQMYTLNINGGAFYTGIDWDLYVGGTFPKTDLIWGFGCIWTFLFPSYSPKYNVQNFNQKFFFYAAPTILFGYDINIKNTNFKITPQMRVGFTCNPNIPYDLVRDINSYGGDYSFAEKYSGLYLDFSVSFSFVSIKWKDTE